MAIECLNSLVGLKELCTADSIQPLFWLDDFQGLDRNALAQLAKSSNGSGKAFGNEIIESSARFLMADIETLIPKGYTIKTSLNSFCNTCTYTGMTSSASNTGVIVKNLSKSPNGLLSIDSLKVMIASTGSYTIVLNDGIEPKMILHDFTAGTEVVITNINFKTTAKSVKIYFLESGVAVNALNCPTTKSCGCSGSTAQSKDLSVKGLLNGGEFTTQYGFVPCASVVCSLDGLICQIVSNQPRLFAVALVYRSVARYFSEFPVTQRLNQNASFGKDEKTALADEYMTLYYERLNGSGNIKGIADNMGAALNSLNDPCVECIRPVSVAWATS
jgi:hypothetical protein